MAVSGRINLYSQVVVVSTVLLGFVLAAVTILVSLDTGRRIVKELHYGEVFKLLIVNMLAVAVLLMVLALIGISGTAFDASGAPAKVFEDFYEWIGVASVLELGLSGFFFSVAICKVAAHE